MKRPLVPWLAQAVENIVVFILLSSEFEFQVGTSDLKFQLESSDSKVPTRKFRFGILTWNFELKFQVGSSNLKFKLGTSDMKF